MTYCASGPVDDRAHREAADTAAIDRMLTLNVNVVMKNVRDALVPMIARGRGGKRAAFSHEEYWGRACAGFGDLSNPFAASNPPGARCAC